MGCGFDPHPGHTFSLEIPSICGIIANMNSKRFVSALTGEAGITINGSNPWDMKIRDERFFDRLVQCGSLGLGETYMDGWWDSEDLEETMARILTANLPLKIIRSPKLLLATAIRLTAGFFGSAGRKSKAFEVGKQHYDVGNDLYKKMLDRRMIYSCAYWKTAKTLEGAQEDKLDLICKKLKLKKGMKLLDIGCGWGGLLEFAAKKYGVTGVGVTVSKEQALIAEEKTKHLPVEIKVIDYRDYVAKDAFDRIVSVGMFEHVGYRHYSVFMKKVFSLLKKDGIFLLHTFGSNRTATRSDAWFERYIFPNSMAPGLSHVEYAARKFFVLEDFENFGPYYTPTLQAWFKNFNNAWPELKNTYNEKFYRMWKYYLLSLAAAFRTRTLHIWQFVFRKHGIGNVYESVR